MSCKPRSIAHNSNAANFDTMSLQPKSPKVHAIVPRAAEWCLHELDPENGSCEDLQTAYKAGLITTIRLRDLT